MSRVHDHGMYPDNRNLDNHRIVKIIVEFIVAVLSMIGYWADFDKEYFEEGTYRYAFRGTIHGEGPRDGTLCVTKVFKKEYAQHFDRKFRPDHAASVHAQRFARIFTENVLPELKTNISTSKIEFLIPLIARIDQLSHYKVLGLFPVDEDRTYLAPCDYVAIEQYIKGDYEKYNSNGGYEDCTAALMNAFSHWTWHVSGHKFLVCDLQGAQNGDRYTLTDPCIHSIDGRYGSTDLGVVGMETYFANHKCNVICEALKLQNPMRGKVETRRPQRPTTYRFQLTEQDLFRARRGESNYIQPGETIVE